LLEDVMSRRSHSSFANLDGICVKNGGSEYGCLEMLMERSRTQPSTPRRPRAVRDDARGAGPSFNPEVRETEQVNSKGQSHAVYTRVSQRVSSL